MSDSPKELQNHLSKPNRLSVGAKRFGELCDRYHWLLFAIILASGILLRIYWITCVFRTISADDALVGVYALRLLKGDPYLFYFVYHGTLAAWATAPAFALLGVSIPVLKGVSLLFSILANLSVYLFGRWAARKEIGLLALLWVSLSPSALTLASIKPEPGYVETMALATPGLALAVLLLSGRLTERRRQVVAMSALGLALGLGLWVNFIIGVYAMAIGLVALFEWRTLLRLPKLGYVLLIGIGSLAGGSPFVYRFLFWRQYNPISNIIMPGHAPLNPLRALQGLVEVNLPILLGGRHSMAQTGPWVDIFSRPVSVLLCLFFCVCLVWALIRGWLTRSDERRIGLRMATALIVITFSSFIFTPYGDTVGIVRYQYPLYAALPFLYASFADGLGRLGRSKGSFQYSGVGLLGVQGFSPRTGGLKAALRSFTWTLERIWPKVLSSVLVIGLLFVNLFGSLTYPGMPELYGHKPGDEDALIGFLLAHNLRYIHTNYWIQMPVAMLSREAVIPSGLGGISVVRLPAYDDRVLAADSRQTAYVFYHGSNGESVFEQKMSSLGIECEKTIVGCYAAFYNFSEFPDVRTLNLPVDGTDLVPAGN